MFSQSPKLRNAFTAMWHAVNERIIIKVTDPVTKNQTELLTVVTGVEGGHTSDGEDVARLYVASPRLAGLPVVCLMRSENATDWYVVRSADRVAQGLPPSMRDYVEISSYLE